MDPLAEHASTTSRIATTLHTLTTPSAQNLPTSSMTTLTTLTTLASHTSPTAVPSHAAAESHEWIEPLYARTLFTGVTMGWMLIIALLVGLRCRQLSWHRIISFQLPLIHYLTLGLYAFAITFIWLSAIMINGPEVTAVGTCHSAVYICLTFYVGSKVLMYVFLVERAHTIRAPYTRRYRDYVWVFFMFCIIVGFSACAGVAFARPYATLVNGKCEIGLPRVTAMTLVVYDVFINFTLTITFIWLLQPLLKFGRPTETPLWKEKLAQWLAPLARRTPFSLPQAQPYRQSLSVEAVRRREWLVWRTLIGCCLVVLPTVLNLVILYKLGGREMGWMCLLLCCSDVTWAVCIIHWLTAGLIEAEEDTFQSARPASVTRSGQHSPGIDLPPFVHEGKESANRDCRLSEGRTTASASSTHMPILDA